MISITRVLSNKNQRDKDAVRIWIRRCLAHMFDPSINACTFLREFIHDSNHLYMLIAHDQNHVLGILVFMRKPVFFNHEKTIHIRQLSTVGHDQKIKGVGTRLLNELDKFVRDADFYVLFPTKNAVGFYFKNGFRWANEKYMVKRIRA